MELLWVLSLWGYVWLTVRKNRIPRAFGPLLSISLLTLSIYVLGLLGWMRWGSVVLMAIGGALGLCGVAESIRKRDGKALLSFGLFCLPCAAFVLRYQGALLVAYDDFSHWGLIARHLLTKHALPTASDALIAFQSYPPAAACWVYYACRFVGGSDGMMLCAQAWFTLAGFWALFGLRSRENHPLQLAAVGGVCLVGVSLFQGTASLMVDNLLAAQATGAFAMTVWARQDQRHTPWMLASVFSVLCLIKDTGLLLAALVWLAMAGWQISKRQIHFSALSVPLLTAAVLRVLWQLRIHIVFPAANMTKHALSIDNMRRMGADKSLEDLAQLALNVGKRALSFSNQATQILLLLALMAVICLIWRRLQEGAWHGRQMLAVVGWACVVYAAYLVALWGMYSFTLPLATARQLVGFERYNSTCALFLYGCAIAVSFVWSEDISASRKTLQTALSVLLVLVVLIPSWRSGIPRLMRETYFVPMREQMQTLQEQRPLQPDETALVVVGEEQAGTAFAEYMARYVFQSTTVTAGLEEMTMPLDVIYVAQGDPAQYDKQADEVVALSNEKE